MKNNNILVFTNTQDSIPKATAGTGTITARNDHRLITGNGTLFLTEVNVWDWIYMKANNEFRQVVDIMSNTELIIDTKFDSNPNGSAYFITPRSRYRSVELMVTGSGDALIDGETLEQGEGLEWNKRDKGKTKNDYVLPIDIDTITNSTTVKATVNH